MLRSIPKHKGTEHLQADIKTRIKELTDELTGPSRTGARGGPPTSIRPEGAGQVVLLGPPNSGKSQLHARVTGSRSEVGAYPFTTQYPLPGMMPVEDVFIQLVDLPPISSQHPVPWIVNAVQQADGALLVVDVSEAGCVEAVIDLLAELERRKIELTDRWPRGGDRPVDDDDPLTVVLPTLLVLAKCELVEDIAAEQSALVELAELELPALAASSETGDGLEALGAWLFEEIGVARVYTKLPGKPPDLDRPYTIRRGDTVEQMATLIHKDFAARLRYARLLRRGEPGERQVGREFALEDGDVVELHV